MAESTRASMFADSAIDMPVSPIPVKHTGLDPSNEPARQFVLSDRLERLTATLWKAEQEQRIGNAQATRLRNTLDRLETQLNQEATSLELPLELAVTEGSKAVAIGASQDAQLGEVLSHLSNTISAMRLRQQERRHLHSLALTRLDAVARRCHDQEEELQEAGKELEILRREKRNLVEDNGALRVKVHQLEDQGQHREVALDAMTSAATGLEGFLDTQRRGPPEAKSTPRRQVIRGRGRFRGKYQAEDLLNRSAAQASSPQAEVKELHDGVRAWLRGFRDVEEEVRSPGRQSAVSRNLLGDVAMSDDDWGRFEEPTK